MPIEDPVYFSWYCDEITRYRDHEWQLASFSIAVSSAILIFANNSDTKNLICPCVLALFNFIIVLFMMVAEIHTHIKLNKFRKKRTLLIEGKEHKGDNDSENPFLKLPFCESKIDFFYTFSFIVFPVLIGIVASWILIK